jgi:hypothetical protein
MYRRGWNTLHRPLTVCPLGDTTSTEVDADPRIDQVTIFFMEEGEK